MRISCVSHAYLLAYLHAYLMRVSGRSPEFHEEVAVLRLDDRLDDEYELPDEYDEPRDDEPRDDEPPLSNRRLVAPCCAAVPSSSSSLSAVSASKASPIPMPETYEHDRHILGLG